MLGGMEVLQCYNPHRTEGFCTIGVLQRCNRGATRCYAPWPEGAGPQSAAAELQPKDFNRRERKDFNRRERKERRDPKGERA